MASKTYHDAVIVLKKTKLKESDLILTMLAEDGRQIRAVAKGARKPTSMFASRLELFTAAEVLFAVGRNLDIVKEAKMTAAHAGLRSDIALAACAAPIAEVLERTTQADLPVPNLYPMALAALAHLEQAENATEPMIAAAFLLKCVSVLGFKPCLDVCVECDCDPYAVCGDYVDFSASLGGLLCRECAQGHETLRLNRRVAEWARVLINARFDDVMGFGADTATAMAVLSFAQTWTREYVGNLKSLSYLLSCGLFSDA